MFFLLHSCCDITPSGLRGRLRRCIAIVIDAQLGSPSCPCEHTRYEALCFGARVHACGMLLTAVVPCACVCASPMTSRRLPRQATSNSTSCSSESCNRLSAPTSRLTPPAKPADGEFVFLSVSERLLVALRVFECPWAYSIALTAVSYRGLFCLRAVVRAEPSVLRSPYVHTVCATSKRKRLLHFASTLHGLSPCNPAPPRLWSETANQFA